MPLALVLDTSLVLTLPVSMVLFVLLVVVGGRLPRFLGRWRGRRVTRYLLCISWTLWLGLLDRLRRTRWLCRRVYRGRLLLSDLLLVRDRRRGFILLIRRCLACTQAF